MIRVIAAMLCAGALLAAAGEVRACSPLYAQPLSFEAPCEGGLPCTVIEKGWPLRAKQAFDQVLRENDSVAIVRPSGFALQWLPPTSRDLELMGREAALEARRQEVDLYRTGRYRFEIIKVVKGQLPTGEVDVGTATDLAVLPPEAQIGGQLEGLSPVGPGCRPSIVFSFHKLYVFAWTSGANRVTNIISLDDSSAPLVLGMKADAYLRASRTR